MYKVSIIIPVYNCEKRLRKSIDSLINQTLKDIEIILVDDGSSDLLSDICDEFACNYGNMIVFHQNNKGVCAARNVGIKFAHGEYIGFLDADDTVENNMFETLYSVATKYDADIVTSDFINKVSKKKNKDIAIINGNTSCVESFLRGEITMSACTKLFSKRTIKDVKFNVNYKINEDKLFVFEAIERANCIIQTNYQFYKYYFDGNSVTHASSYTKWLDMMYIADDILNDVKAKYPWLIGEANSSKLCAVIMMYRALMKAKGKEHIDKDVWDFLKKEIRTLSLSEIDFTVFSLEQKLSYLGLKHCPQIYAFLYVMFYKGVFYKKYKAKFYNET